MSFYEFRRFWVSLPTSEKMIWPLVLIGFPMLMLGLAVITP